MIVDQSGQTYEVDPSTCTITPLIQCFGGYITSIALINNMVYFSNGSNLYRYPYNTSAACEYLGPFPSLSTTVTSLTSGPNGLVYAASGSTIYSYNPITNSFANLGTIPSPWQSSGDLIFYENELLLTTVNEELIKIDLDNLANSHAVLPFPANTSVYGLATVSTGCSSNLVFGLNATNTGTTQLLPINLVTNTVGSPTCTLPLTVFDAASLSENGSTNLLIPTFTAVGPICTGAKVPPLPTTSNNSITGTWSPALNNTATTIYTFTPTIGFCASPTTLTIVISPIVTPTFTPVGPICTGETLLQLPTTSTNGITGTWSPALSNTATTTYTFTPTTGLCANSTTLTIIISPGATPLFTPIATICSGDLLSPLPTTSNNSITGTWSPVLNNTATTTYTFTPTTQCASSASLTISVIPPINIALNDADLCIDPDTHLPKYHVFLITNLNNPNYTYNWYFNGSLLPGEHSNDLLINQIGQYYVTVTNNLTNCVSTSNTAIVSQIEIIHEFDIAVIAEFTNNASIIVTPFSANFLYQIDNLTFQSSNVFENVSYGVHSISVTDSILCTDFHGQIFVPGYPKFFTPNGDGYNEFWNVFGFNYSDIYKVSIFDRYGKFIYEINNRSDGWDGKLNGRVLPSTDYWFVVNYYLNNQFKTFKGHFSLKR
ncbi:MAG: T9SS type B sorting domain-containing protein [Flavobacterium sp.]|uniref:T9SS type B sorting domain-containing protein n=1 Tax=Flavobacterium sp. TaxID=239 RepID=UPI0032666D29